MPNFKIKNPSFLRVTDETAKNNISYGFSQEWYKDDFQILAGCGATVASTILTYYSQYSEYKKLKVSDVLPLMEELWKYLLPLRNKGLNSTKLFYDGITNYFKDKNLKVNYSFLDINVKNKIPLDEIIKYLKYELSNDRPVAFLNLSNGEELALDKWHWVTVFEIFEENNQTFLNIFDDREIKKINLSLWYSTMEDDGGFVSFYS